MYLRINFTLICIASLMLSQVNCYKIQNPCLTVIINQSSEKKLFANRSRGCEDNDMLNHAKPEIMT